ncbi:MAG: preprotein translocase subunit SecE [Candidatus Nomurabacteria bacterium]|jgi:preprotein translocase SecE subunit|nr:preprotein translocase subunit SecE [Candidatus Nomurabacteria bacterium]
MAEKKTKVRRIKAKPISKKSKSVAKKTKKNKRQAPKWLKKLGQVLGKVFGPIGRFFAPAVEYVKGSFYELRQTRWPNRKATWGLTIAVILFSIFFAALILSFDNVFNWLMETILNMKGSN